MFAADVANVFEEGLCAREVAGRGSDSGGVGADHRLLYPWTPRRAIIFSTCAIDSGTVASNPAGPSV
jgi:hypothetical protein